MNLQNKGHFRQSGTRTPSPPLSPKVAPVVVMDGESAGGGGGGGEDAEEAGLNEQQQQAMQREERILTEQIESLQKEKYGRPPRWSFISFYLISCWPPMNKGSPAVILNVITYPFSLQGPTLTVLHLLSGSNGPHLL